MRFLLAPLRLAALIVHILAGLAILWLIFPRASRMRRNRIIRGWSALLVRLCGARVQATGCELSDAVARDGLTPDALGRLVLANHVSWLDVFAIHAVLPSRFVAKSEIGDWPLLGALVTRSGTLYIERGRRHAVAAVNHTVAVHLQAGETVALFPEGTTTAGSELLPFHSNLLAPALESAAPVWPVAVRYTECGEPTTAAAFIGDMGLVTSLAHILTARNLVVEIAVLPALDPRDHPNRHELARAARHAIAAKLGIATD